MPNRKLVATFAAVALIITSCSSSTSKTSSAASSTSAISGSTTVPVDSTGASTPASTGASAPATTAVGTGSTSTQLPGTTVPPLTCGDGLLPAGVTSSGWCSRHSNDPALVGMTPQCVYREGELLSTGSDKQLEGALVNGLNATITDIGPRLGSTEYRVVRFTGVDPALAASQIPGAVPNYLVASTMGWTFGPGGDATLQPNFTSRTGGEASPGGTTVLILDTAAAAQRAGARVAGIKTSGELLGYSAAQFGGSLSGDDIDVGLTAGHGTFIASLIRRVLPNVNIVVAQVPAWPVTLTQAGVSWQTAASDTATVTAALESYDMTGVTHLNLSLGTYGCPADVTKGLQEKNSMWRAPMPIFEALGRNVPSTAKVFAAAGNDASDRPFYPAAWGVCPSVSEVICSGNKSADLAIADMITSVGSTACKFACVTKGAVAQPPMDGKMFSNEGGWVEVVAVGSEVVGNRPVSYLSTGDKPSKPQAEGDYRWSGTSFATPCALALAAALGTALQPKTVQTYDCNLGA
jgi:hypothetical protein